MKRGKRKKQEMRNLLCVSSGEGGQRLSNAGRNLIARMSIVRSTFGPSFRSMPADGEEGKHCPRVVVDKRQSINEIGIGKEREEERSQVDNLICRT